jgi:putative phosphoribosyl transferase
LRIGSSYIDSLNLPGEREMILQTEPDTQEEYRRSRWDGPPFADRADAGRQLVEVLTGTPLAPDIVVAGSAAGLPVARSVADHYEVPLDLVVTRRITPPGDANLTVGAVTEGGTVWVDEAQLPGLNNADEFTRAAAAREYERASAAAERYRVTETRSRPTLEGRRALLVTDGIDACTPVVAAVRHLRRAGADRVTVGTPVVAPRCVDRVEGPVDGLFGVERQPSFDSVAQFYETFDDVSEDKARRLLRGERR